MKKIFPLILSIFIGCEDGIEPIKSIEFVPNMNLPMDADGYYHFKLSESSWQSIHTIGGTLFRNNKPMNITKCGWASNMFWEYGNEECYIKEISGENFSNCDDYEFDENLVVPIVNGSSYSREDGTINTVIAPIKIMKGDTMTIYIAWWDEWKYERGDADPIYIILN